MFKINTSHLIIYFCLFICGFTTAQQSSSEMILRQKAEVLGWNSQDLTDLIVTDAYTSRGISHAYYAQSLNGLRILNTTAAVHQKTGVDPYIHLDFLTAIQKRPILNIRQLSAEQAILAVALTKEYNTSEKIDAIGFPDGVERRQTIKAPSISLSDIPVKLVYFPTKKSFLLAWDMVIEEVDDAFLWNYIVDAATGQILEEIPWTVSCDFESNHDQHEHNDKLDHVPLTNSMGSDSSYNIFPWPVESPNFGIRSEVIRPWLDNTSASPVGWHTIGANSYNSTRGNNVDAYDDSDNSNSPTGGDAARADGGVNLDFDFPLDIAQNPVDYKNAAITNLFYWNNLIHDVWYNYGFDEPSGNFQELNYSGMGAASDYVRAEAQDGSGSCNANFGTPSDGGNPRMQMYLCNGRDGDFDNGVVVHEYGHGISNRLTGGPSASGCLNNQEQMGEGWSDWFGMVMTIEPGDTGADSRGMGTWLFGQGPTGNGIRPFPYSTDMNINPMTYQTISNTNISNPHGVGSVWCTMLWDLTWAFIDTYGFDPDIYNGTGGNNMIMELVILGCKLQPCKPGFVDGRDAILAADNMLFAGANECMIWEVFANRGLGFSASQGYTANKYDGKEAFDLPDGCTVVLDKVANVSSRNKGENVVFTLMATNNTDVLQTGLTITDDIPENMIFVSATNGGVNNAGTVEWPAFDLLPSASMSVTFTAQVDPLLDATIADISDDMESGTGRWNITDVGSTSWVLQSNTSNSPSNAWYADDETTAGVAYLALNQTIGVTDTSTLSFSHSYNTETEWDGGIVEISIDGGISWNDLGIHMTQNGYNNTIYNLAPGFSGNSVGFITTIVDLSAFSGHVASIRFAMHCDVSVGGIGWYIDDVTLNNLGYVISNTAQVSNENITSYGMLADHVAITVPPNALTAQITSSRTSCFGYANGSATVTPSAGTGLYTYNWSNGGITPTINGLVAGLYTVTINDGLDAISKSIVVGQPDQLILKMNTEPSFTGNNGSASVLVLNGLPPYSYSWSNGGMSSQITNLAPNIYTVSVTDSTPCLESNSIEVINPNNCDINRFATRINIQLDQFPEETSYVIRDSGNNIVGQGGTYQSLPDGSLVSDYYCLPDGCYTFEIMDTYGDGICASNSNPQGYYEVVDYFTNDVFVTGCNFGFGETVAFCVNPMVVAMTSSAPTCEGDSDGSATANATAGSGVYTYAWSNSGNTATINNVTSGMYHVTINDGQTSVMDSVFVPQSQSFVMVTSNAGPLSLRQVIADACVVDTIRFDPSLLQSTISLTSEIVINKDVRIKGFGRDDLSISGNDATRQFHVSPGFELYVEGLTLSNGRSAVNGGAIFNEGLLKLIDVLFVNNLDGPNKRPFSNTGNVEVVGEVIIQE